MSLLPSSSSSSSPGASLTRATSAREVEEAIARGETVNPDTQNLEEVPILVACRNGNLEVVKSLLEHGSYKGAPRKPSELRSLLPTPLCVALHHRRKSVVQVLVEAGADVNRESFYPRSQTFPILLACIWRDEDLVNLLLDHGAKVNTRNNRGESVIALLCTWRHLPLLDRATSMGIKFHRKDSEGYTPLHYVCKSGDKELFDRLVKQKFNINVSERGQTFLHTACLHKHYSIAKRLVALGAELNPISYGNLTPLQIVSENGQTNIFDLLIKNGANLEINSEYETAALYYASKSGNVDIVDRLIEIKAEIDQTTKEGCTALMVACANGRIDVVDRLLAAGANVNKRDNKNKSVLLYAIDSGMLCILDRLIAFGADYFSLYGSDFSCLMFACFKSHYDLVDRFISLGMDVHARDDKGRTVLMIASLEEDEKIVELLVKNGSRLEDVDFLGKTALIHACLQRTIRVVGKLIELGANVNLRTGREKNPLTTAFFTDYEVFPLLRAAKPDLTTFGENRLSVFILACASEDIELAKEALAQGCDPKLEAHDGSQALQYAVQRKCSTEMIDFLVSLGLDLNHVNHGGEFPLYNAVRGNFLDCVKRLLFHGARSDMLYKGQPLVNYTDRKGIKNLLLRSEAKTIAKSSLTPKKRGRPTGSDDE